MFRVLVLLITQTCLIYGQDILKGSLTFVIDDTASMSNEILQVKESVNFIFDKVTSSRESQIENFVLVTFNDPDSRLRTITKNKHEFKSALENIQVDGGGDCPEFSMSGIKLALQSSLPNSIFYVYTDASAKDYGMMEEVRNIATKNHVQVSFLLTGECSSRSDPDYQVYNDLANATYGDVYNMMKSDIKDIMNFIGERIEGRDELLAAGSFPPGAHKLPPFKIDGKMGDVTLSASGASPSIKVTDHKNDTVKTTDVVSKPEILITKLVDPKPGTYTAEVSSSSGVSARVRAKTTINIEARFSGFEPTSPDDTATAPSPEGNTILSIILHGEGVKLENVIVFDMSGNVVATLPLRLVDEKDKFYVADSCDPPKIFRVSVFGYDEADKSPVKRDVATPIERQTMKFVKADDVAPTITIDDAPEIITDYNAPFRLKCNIHAYPKPEITWVEKDTGVTIPANVTIKDVPYDYISVLSIDKMKKNSTYECKATNAVGRSSNYIKVSMNTYFNVIETPDERLHIFYDEETKMVCKVDANPPATITWYKDGRPITSNINVKISGDMTALTIQHVNLDSQGSYMCEIRNDLNRKIFHAELDVLGLKEPKIDKTDEAIYAAEGENAEITCRITEGVPPPIRKWYFQPKGSDAFEEISETGETLYFYEFSRDDIGTYKCVATNIKGSEQYAVDLVMTYPPTIENDLPQFIRAEEGLEVTLPCDVDGEPTPKVTWSNKEGELVDSRHTRVTANHALKIREIRVVDAGFYYCEATNEFGSAKKKVYVDVFVAPNILIPKFTSFASLVGRDLLLPCEVDGYPKPKVRWVYNDLHGKWAPKNIRPNIRSSLSLRKLQLPDEGYYTCVASNIGGESNLTFTVRVNAPPVIENTYRSRTFKAVKGDLVLQIQCKATGRPEPTIVWKKNGFNIASGTDWYDIDDGTLIIKNVDEASQGEYLCYAENKIGHDSIMYKVEVDDYPVPGVHISEKVVENEMTVKIPCDIPHKEVDLLRWYKDRRLIKIGELTLDPVSLRDAGFYSCRVSNMTKSMSAHVRVSVGFKPSFLSEEETVINFVQGDSIALNCDAVGEPEPEVIWKFNDAVIHVTDMFYELTMELDNKGRYTCEVKNSLGSINRTFTMISKECVLDTGKDFLHTNQPIMTTTSLTWPNFSIIDNHMFINYAALFFLHCPKGFTSFPAQTVYAFCEGETKVKINGHIYEFSDIKCKEETELTVRETGRNCLRRSAAEFVEIGYTITGKFLKAFDVCLDKMKHVPLYAQHDLSKLQYNVDKNRTKWSEHILLPFNFEIMYDCYNQAGDITFTLGKDFHSYDGCCFGKRQLVNAKDLLPGIPVAAAYSYLNVIPHWSTCNSKNWDDVEERVRKLSKSFRNHLKVITGTAKPLRMGNPLYPSEISLHDDRDAGQSIGEYLWKIVLDQDTSRGLAIIQVNVPDLKLSDVPSHVLCKDICHEVKWLAGGDWHNVANGYTYCCSIDTFEAKFHFYRQFSYGRRTGILRDVFYAPKYY